MKTPQTPNNELARALGLATDVWLKREDLHHFGSHKGRSIPRMIEEHAQQGAREFVISSSGNAALAAALYTSHHNHNKPSNAITLKIFVGEKIAAAKLQKIKTLAANDQSIAIKAAERPKQSAITEAHAGAIFLRQSTDSYATLGYHELALELSKIEKLAAVFVPTSSGTTAVGLYEGFKKIGLNPHIYIIQTTSCHPMVEARPPLNLPLKRGRDTSAMPITPPPFKEGAGGWSRVGQGGDKGEVSLATAIVDNIAHRKAEVLTALTKSGGAGYIATNQEITDAQKLLRETCQLEISPNSALSVVGLIQAIKKGRSFPGPVCCLITGD